MKLKTIVLSLAVAMLSTKIALAHPEHDHPRKPPPTAPASIDETAAKSRAHEEVSRLVSVKKIHESWKDKGRFNAIKKSGDAKKWEWLVTFDNDQVKDNKRLYVFLKPSGEFVAANFTGK